MNYKKTIRLLEPHGGWGISSEYYNKNITNSNYKIILNNDTGLCNRIFHWEALHHAVVEANDDEVHIAVQKEWWPEIELLEIPDTVAVEYEPTRGNDWYSGIEQSNLYLKTIFDTSNNSLELSKQMTKEFFYNLFKNKNFEKILENNHWYLDEGYITLSSIGTDVFDYKDGDEFCKKLFINNKIRPIDKIHLKDNSVQKDITKKYQSYVGIHIRRGNGIHLTDEVIENLPADKKEEYVEYYKNNFKIDCEAYKFINDTEYYTSIDEILKINPKQKIYISHDLTDNLIENFYEKYPKNIVTKKDIRKKYYNHYKKRIPNLDHLIKYGNILDNVLDLFIFASCGFKVLYANSTWSEFAGKYRKPENQINLTSEQFIIMLKENKECLKEIIDNLPKQKIL